MKTAIKKFAIDLRIRVGYGTAFFLLLSSYLLTLYANSELLKQARLVDHSNKIIYGVEALLSSLKDAETGFRGYLLMNERKFLAPYIQSRQAVDSIYNSLLQETAVDHEEHSELATLQRLIDKKFEVMQQGLALHEQHLFQLTDSLKMKGFFDLEIMNHIRTIVKQVQETEQQRLKVRMDTMTTRYRTLNNVIIMSLGVAILMALFGYYTYSYENNARRVADKRVEEYQQQLKEQIEELDNANKELIKMRSIEKFAATGRIARTIAHEVRNPLTNINLAVEQLQSELKAKEAGSAKEAGNAKVADSTDSADIMLEMIARNSARINLLITDLLNSTKFTELVYQRFSANQLLDETLELAKDRITLKNVTVIKTYMNGICDILVDQERIKIAFLNIIVNAIEAMEPGSGILQLKTFSRDDKCIISITDNGPGIDEESLSKVFEPYFTSKIRGTGLGLTNTQNIILNHKGQIGLESKKGIGTTFTIQLDFA
ncbi:MAG TPA: CHASE3 domain-containing protein [Puia sp.]|nr:CHASE3 domain-containing protein [Puia sp.]